MTSPVTEGFIEVGARRTWYRCTGSPTHRPPLVLLHGGPGGCSPDDVLAVDVVARDRLVVEYDQVDVGRSSRVGDPSAWTVAGHLAELAAVRDALGLTEVHLCGASWGGMLAMSHVLDGANGVRSLTLASAPVSIPRWLETAARFRDALPAPTQRALARCERSLLRSAPRRVKPGPGRSAASLRRQARVTAKVIPGLGSWPVQAAARVASFVPPFRRAAYQVLNIELVRRHVFRGPRFPEGMLVGQVGMNASVYETMWGPSEFVAPGPLKDFDLTDRLGEIDVPLLVTSGAHELASPEQMADVVAAVPGAQWELFEDCGHCSVFEEPERFATVLREFLLKVDDR